MRNLSLFKRKKNIKSIFRIRNVYFFILKKKKITMTESC